MIIGGKNVPALVMIVVAGIGQKVRNKRGAAPPWATGGKILLGLDFLLHLFNIF